MLWAVDAAGLGRGLGCVELGAVQGEFRVP